MIETAIQRGKTVYVYGPMNHMLFSKMGELKGYTGSSVSVQQGNYVYTFDEKGRSISSHYVG